MPVPRRAIALLIPMSLFAASACALSLAGVGGQAAINWYVPNTNYSIAWNWNERALEGIRMDTPHPRHEARRPHD